MSRSIVVTLQRNLRVALRKRDFVQAREILNALKEEDPTSVATRGLELELCVDSGHLDEAEKLASQLTGRFPASSRVQFLAGKAAYKRRRYGDALHHFKESHRLVAHWRSQQWIGKTLTQLGQFDEALGLLEKARQHNPFVEGDLAWLHERMGNLEKAISSLERLSEFAPDDKTIEQRVVQLKGQLLDPEDLIDEVEGLEDMGEDIPNHLLPTYLDNLMKSGEIHRARSVVSTYRDRLDARATVNVAWICYRLQQYDLAMDLFLSQLELNVLNFKFLNALETSARKIDRQHELQATYDDLGQKHKNLLGRAKRLNRVR